MNYSTPKISIGIPVYNGEKFIRKCIESVLQQTNRNFELIISDNASTDSSPEICKEFLNKDNRITFVRQNKNMGRLWNFHFLVKKAVGEYFVWVPVDTFLLPEFLERNIAVLESQDKVVGCISKIKIVDNSIDRFETQKRILKKIGLVYRPFDTLPITGNYNERIRKYLKHFPWEMFYSVFRTKALRDSVVLNPSFLVGHDAGLVLNILKHGEIQVVDQILLESIPVGGAFTYKFYKNIMPYYPLTKWCIKNLGWKIFFRNIDHFLRLGLDGMIIQYTSFYKNIKEK
jgi:glycosyltransferase involved in cell wall biosynthesis|tara:strand:- start:1011 stop:1871 length:861 start_codon:yes stop_codon:yes gene_type:complete